MTAQEIIQAVSNAARRKGLKATEVDKFAQFILYVHIELTYSEVAELFKHNQHRLILLNVEIIGVRLNIYEEVRDVYETVMGQIKPAA